MGIKDTALWKAAREVKSCLGTIRDYSIITGSYCLGRCDKDRMKAYFREYSRMKRKRRMSWRGEKLEVREYNGKRILTLDEANKMIGDAIEAGKPFMAGRFGAGELATTWRVNDSGKIIVPIQKALNGLCTFSGFFPNDKKFMPQFAALTRWSTYRADLMCIWVYLMEEYEIRTYGNNPEYVRGSFEPFLSSCPWSAKLEGKKVLVVHPFDQTIQEQYKKRKLLFPGKNILPDFDLRVVKAVQTLAGTKDERFATWFDALDYMYDEAMKEDFDVAVLGCGAYGFPLAAKLKEAGKIAIHMGGSTQLLFGIRGSRWEAESYKDTYAKMLSNPAWVRPGENDKFKNFMKIEDGCYW